MRLRAIVPGKIVSSKEVEAAVTDAVNSSLEVIKRDFERTTKTWNRKVVFYIDVGGLAAGGVGGTVATDDEIYGYVESGTPPHIIAARMAKVLRYSQGYASKTAPRVIGSHRGGSSGGLIFTERVQHPGITSRHFVDEIANRREKMFQDRIEQAILRATRG